MIFAELFPGIGRGSRFSPQGSSAEWVQQGTPPRCCWPSWLPPRKSAATWRAPCVLATRGRAPRVAFPRRLSISSTSPMTASSLKMGLGNYPLSLLRAWLSTSPSLLNLRCASLSPSERGSGRPPLPPSRALCPAVARPLSGQRLALARARRERRAPVAAAGPVGGPSGGLRGPSGSPRRPG